MFNTIRSKLVFSFVLVFLIIAGQGFITYSFTQDNNRLANQAVGHDFNASIQISELAILAQKIRRYEKEYFMYIGNAEKQAKYEKEWLATFAKIEAKLDAIQNDRSGVWTAADRFVFISQWNESIKAYGEGFRNVIAGVNRGEYTDTLSANSAVQDAKNAFRVFLNGTIEMANKKYIHASAASQQIKTKSDWLNMALLGTLALSALICLALMLIIPRAIIKPIKRLSSSASAMSQGELDQPVPATDGIKDFGELAATLERMRISQKALLSRMGANPMKSAA